MNPKLIKYAEWIVAILLSATVLFLLIVRSTHTGGLWRDECDSLELARLPTFADVLHNLKFTSFPILFPTIVRVFTSLFGTSDASLRCFGFLVGAALLGVALPGALRAMRRDPRIASGPIVLALTDFLALVFYFNVARWLLE